MVAIITLWVADNSIFDYGFCQFLASQNNFDWAILISKLNGIRNEVHEYLFEPFFITVEALKKLCIKWIYHQLSTDVFFAGHEFKCTDTLADRSNDIGELSEELKCLVLLLSEVKQVINQIDQSARAMVANLKHLLALIGLLHSVTVLADDFFELIF